MSTAPNIVWFADLDTQAQHHGRHAKHHALLTQAKFPLVPGFVITPHAYYAFLKENNLELKIKQLLSTISFELSDSLMQGEFHIKQLFIHAQLSDTFIEELLSYYLKLGPEVIIELIELGIHEKKQHTVSISAKDTVTKHVRALWAEMFSAKALWHRNLAHHDHLRTGCEIVIQKKVHGDKTGTVLTSDPETAAKDKIFIHREHAHNGDHYLLSKKNLNIIDRSLKHTLQNDKLTSDEILDIATVAKRLEEHLYFPQEITWVLDGKKLYITKIKPLTQLPKQKAQAQRKLPIARGKGLTSRIGTGIATIIHPHATLPRLTTHNIIVISEMKPNQVKKFTKSGGIIIEQHPHAQTAALLKHYGIPVICNVKHATKNFLNGNILTIHAGKGEIYRGGFL